MFFSDVVVDDVTAEIQQSTDGENFDSVAASEVTLIKTNPSYSWNVTGLTFGIFLRVKIKKGSAAAGIVSKINTLF